MKLLSKCWQGMLSSQSLVAVGLLPGSLTHMCRLNVHAGCWLDSSAASYVGLYLGLLATWQCAILRTKIRGREEKGERERRTERKIEKVRETKGKIEGTHSQSQSLFII